MQHKGRNSRPLARPRSNSQPQGPLRKEKRLPRFGTLGNLRTHSPSKRVSSAITTFWRKEVSKQSGNLLRSHVENGIVFLGRFRNHPPPRWPLLTPCAQCIWDRVVEKTGDLDGSGTLDRKEIRKLLPSLGYYTLLPEQKALVEQFQAAGELDFHECRKMIEALHMAVTSICHHLSETITLQHPLRKTIALGDITWDYLK